MLCCFSTDHTHCPADDQGGPAGERSVIARLRYFTRCGYSGRAGFSGGDLARPESTNSMAFSSCGSLPAITSAGHCSTSTSGGTPWFSTTQPSSVQMARFGAVTPAAVHQRREAEDSDQPAPGPLAHQRAELQLAEHPGQHVAAGAGRLVDEHDLRAVDGAAGLARVLAVASRPHRQWRANQMADVVVGHLAAAVESLVDDDRLLVALRIEVALEIVVARPAVSGT